MRNIIRKLSEMFNLNGRDLPVFLLSLLLAFSIWMIHNLSLRYTDFIHVYVTARCNVEGHSAVSSNKCDVMARCRTTGYNIMKAKMFGRNKSVELQLEKINRKSDDVFYITAGELQEYAHLVFGDNVAVEYYITDTLFFKFPYESNRKVPVRAVSMVTYAPQYMSTTSGVTVEPDSVTIYGDPALIEKLECVNTFPIRLYSLKDNVRGIAKLEHPKGIRLSEDAVRYSLDVVRYVEIPVSVQVGVRNVPPDKDMAIYPTSAQVSFKCAFPFEPESVDDVKFYVDYNDFVASRTGECVLRYDALPQGVLGCVMTPQVCNCVMRDR